MRRKGFEFGVFRVTSWIAIRRKDSIHEITRSHTKKESVESLKRHHRRLKSVIGLLLTSLVSAQPLISQTSSPEQPSKAVTGHYRLINPVTPNSLEVLQLPSGKIQFHLLALWVSRNNREDVYELEGIVELKGNKATYETEGCKVTIRFFTTTATVIQDSKLGDCDFGVGVTATGIYRKLNTRKPKFGRPNLISQRNQQ